MKKYLLILSLFAVKVVMAQQCPIIPLPAQAKISSGNFILTDNTPIIFEDNLIGKQANFLQREVLKNTGYTLSLSSKAKGAGIVLAIDKNKTDEGYALSIKPTGIKISAGTAHGLFNGVTSLLQLIRLADNNQKVISLPCWTIKDAPQFTWRGILLDESRHFFGKAMVKELLDWMAYYKLNKLHWHLTDVPGWRMQIKAYPLLSLTGGLGDYDDPNTASQYYTQEDIKEIVDYAADRFIDIMPEIDMPGHAAAANRAYPAFSGGGSKQHPEFTFNPGPDTTYTYLSNILKETDALFPSQIVHLGGDEVRFGSEKWKDNASVMQLMKAHNLKDLVDVEHYFTMRMADSVFKLNNKIGLWDEAVDSDLPKDKTIIFWWRHDQPLQLKKAMEKGYSAVLCPRIPFYFDFVQDAGQHYGRRWKDGLFASLDNVYNFSISGLPVNKDQQKQLLGVEAALWSEVIPNRTKLEYMVFPRITALAEAAWTGDQVQKDINAFKNRVKTQLPLYHKDGIYYYNPFNPAQTPEPLGVRQIDAGK